jgi:hypothetical protein
MLMVVIVVTLAWLLFVYAGQGRDPRVYVDEAELARHTSPPVKLDEFSEFVKDLILDSQIPDAEAWQPRPLEMPALDEARFIAAMRPKIDEFLKRAAELIPSDSDRSSSLRQLLKDLEHDLKTVAAQVRLQTAFDNFPSPEGHWAEYYRRMIEAELRESQHDPRRN